MKKAFCFIIMLVSVHVSQAQLTLTRGEVYNYDPGDEFLTRLHSFPHWGSPSFDSHLDRTTILSKSFSSGMDTVFYNCLHESRDIYYAQQDTNYLQEYISLFYTDLDSLIQDFAGYDPCYADSVDTVYISTTQYCSRKIYTKYYVWGDCFEPSNYSPKYVEGCGGPYWQADGVGETSYFDLIYYKKVNDSCGTDISINVGIREAKYPEATLTLYPNPATTTLTIESTVNSPQTTVAIHNAQGQLVTSSVVEKQTSTFDISSFSNGIYFLTLSNEEQTLSRKFVKE